MTDRAIILAAGLGTRLKPMTDHAPKCLTEVNGIPVLINTLNNLKKNGIEKCTIVTGYLGDTIIKTLGKIYQGMKINYVYNEKFEVTNDMYSLWLAREDLEKGAIILEGDIFFRMHTLKRAFKKMKSRSFYFAGKYDGRQNEILIKTNSDYRIESITILRNISEKKEDKSFMSSGIIIVEEDYGKLLSTWLTEFVNQGIVDVLFDDVISKHVKEAPLYVFEIEHSEWVEIDTLEDLRRAEKVFGTVN